MRCQCCYPGDIRQCDLSADERHPMHMSIVREHTPSRAKGDVVTWTEDWRPRPPSRIFLERQVLRRQSNKVLEQALVGTGLTMEDLWKELTMEDGPAVKRVSKRRRPL